MTAMGTLSAWLVAAAISAPEWVVLTFDGPKDLAEERRTFRVLFDNALRDEGQRVRATGGSAICGDAACALGAAQAIGVDRAVGGSIGRFGSKLMVTAFLVDAGRERQMQSRQITVDRLEDLDVAAVRLAAALVGDCSADSTVELGNITALETEPDRRRRGTGGLSLLLGAMFPLSETYGGASGGLGVDLGYWFETRHFAIEPTLGFRVSTDAGGERRFYEVPIDIGGYFIAGRGDVSAFLGGGGGLRYIWVREPGTVRVGSVIQTQHQGELTDDRAGAGVFGRAGLLFLRTYRVRLSVSARYEVTFIELNGGAFPQALSAQLAVHF